ncbi:pentapeptide repeat-containing protein [Nodosilinea sp. LEGE 07088]|nr:pentapeptide repeat-containing protein [Nodosilinea sp. LEGE 07088]
MKVNEVLKRYATGDRNFGSSNLCGQSFKGQDLSGADFRKSDIRGADFSQSNLSGTRFNHCQAGLTPLRTIIFIVLSWLLAAISGVFLGLAIYLVLLIFVPTPLLIQGMGSEYKPGLEWIGLFTLILLLTQIFFSRFLGQVAFHTLGAILSLSLVILTLLAISDIPVAENFFGAIMAAWSGVFAIESGGAIASAMLQIIVRKKAIIVGISIIINALFAIAVIDLINYEYELLNLDGWSGIAVGICKILIPVAASIFSAFVGVGIFRNTDNRSWLRKIIIAFISIKGRGTSFHQANLTDAEFSAAILPNTDFQGANFTRTFWQDTQLFHLSLIEQTYLADAQIKKLVTSGEGQGQSFDYKDMRGVNLQNAQLADASFIGANLSEANLSGANLSRAKLVRTQLYRANISNTTLTGAYIQDWGISTDTQFDGIQCDYIYMRLPTPADPDPCRKPDNRNETFAPGDFENFIAPIIKTLDLYSQQNVDPRNVAEAYKTIDLFHHEGIDPSAAAIALQQLAEQHPEAGIEVVALEGRGQDQIRLQAIVSSQANRSELSAQYSENYNQLKALPYSDLQTLLSSIIDKDQQIHRLETMLEQAIQQPRFYVETYRHQGEFIMSQSKGNINIEGVQGNVSGVAAAGDHLEMTGTLLGEISGTVTNTINQLPSSSDPNQPGLKELLTQLQAAIESEAELSNEDKAEALEQVKVLAEAGQQPEDGPLKKSAKTALKILKGTIASLPSATDLVQESSKLLIAIAALLAIV